MTQAHTEPTVCQTKKPAEAGLSQFAVTANQVRQAAGRYLELTVPAVQFHDLPSLLVKMSVEAVMEELTPASFIDAITLSVARLVGSEQIEPAQGWRLIVVALLSNLVFKGAMAALLGDGRLRRWILLLFGIQVLTGAAVLAFWPS